MAGADGIRPYLTRRGKYGLWQDRSYCQPNTVMFADNFQALVKTPRGGGKSDMGIPSRSLRHDRSNNEIRRGLRALEDVGRVDVKLDPRGGMATATVTWTERAYLPKPTPSPTALAADGERAIECLTAGIT